MSAAEETHVMPRNDLVAHEVSCGCVCGPQVMPEKLSDGSMAWVVVHHALDGRA